MQKVILISTMIFIAASLTYSCNDSGDTKGSADTLGPSSNVYKGVDTTGYDIIYEKGGILIASVKDDSAILTEGIEPKIAVEMIKEYVKQDVVNQTLTDDHAKYVDFHIESLIKFYAGYLEAGRKPDSLRIYFGQYTAPTAGNHQDRVGKVSCILVGMEGNKDIYDVSNPKLRPINIGTLCPPGCIKDDFNDQNKGAIYLKKGAWEAGARRW